MDRAKFETALEAYRETVENTIREHFDRNGFTFAVPHVEVKSRGKRFAKLAQYETRDGERTGQTFVHSFVEIETGAIFKPASWKAPAKHSRGNIHSDDHGRHAISAQGHVHYLR